MKQYLLKISPYLVIFFFFACIACVYMYPELQGQRIGSSDNVEAISAVGESSSYRGATGKQTWWNGAMYSGMPNYQIGGARYASDRWIAPVVDFLHKGYSSPIFLVFLFLTCFYILLASMKFGKKLSVVGAIAMAFSSYFFIIIGAGHVTKATGIALMTLALAGFYRIFHGHRRTGVCLALVGTVAGFFPHPQMTYYICFLFAAFGCAELWTAYKTKAWKVFGVNCAIALASLGIGVGTNLSNAFANMEYVKETMRGGQSDLTPVVKAEAKTAAKTQSKGLDFKYATQYSYGIDETLTFLIPDYNGGSSNYHIQLTPEETKGFTRLGIDAFELLYYSKSASLYWGEQPFTSGPVYLGAVVLLLFVLSLFVTRGAYKWALLSVSLLSLLLSWGYHLEWFSQLFFEYFPWFSKFRAVSSILIVAEIAVPLLAIMGIRNIIDGLQNGTLAKEKLKKYIYISTGITAGICLLAFIVVSLYGSFKTGGEVLATANGQNKEILMEIVKLRRGLFQYDVLRSICFILAASAIMLIYVSGKMKQVWMVAAVGGLILFDMWAVDKRYVNSDFFSEPSDYSAKFAMQPWEQHILSQDKTPSFRVWNRTVNTFNEARTSYRLKSVGGYSAAKLRRYNDLIEQHLNKGHMPVYNMLNTKYVIMPDSMTRQPVALWNPEAMGNAWFVDKVVAAKNPNEECGKLMKVDLKKTAIVGKDYLSHVKNMNPGQDTTAAVIMYKYYPNCLRYKSRCARPGIIVFSEIFYPYGWKAYVDNKEVDIFRANFLLRAINIEAGEHDIRFEFLPDSVMTGNIVSGVFIALFYIVVLLCIGLGIRDWMRNRRNA